MEDAFLHEPPTRKQLILDVDKYVDFYLDYLAWWETMDEPSLRIPASSVEFQPEGVQFL